MWLSLVAVLGFLHRGFFFVNLFVWMVVFVVDYVDVVIVVVLRFVHGFPVANVFV